ncbi:MAG: hypothetical protein AB1650_01605 [Candidatus Omnitrophota bacterium]
MPEIGKKKEFKKFFDGLIKKSESGSKSFLSFFKSISGGSGYGNTGNIIRIYYLKDDYSFMILEDGSKWERSYTFRVNQIYWSPGDRVIVDRRNVRRGVQIFSIYNLDIKDEGRDEETAFWIFQGYEKEMPSGNLQDRIKPDQSYRV